MAGSTGVSKALEAEDVLVELGGLLEILDDDSEVSDAHCFLPLLWW
jgi:hypothetical protein